MTRPEMGAGRMSRNLPRAAELTGSDPDHPETQAQTLARLELKLADAVADADALRERLGQEQGININLRAHLTVIWCGWLLEGKVGK